MKQDGQGKYIELADFLKVIGLVATGGQAKQLIRSGEITVNGENETRVRRKLRDGFIVGVKGKTFTADLTKLM